MTIGTDERNDLATQGKRLVIVDDEPALLIPMSRYFRNLGCTVDVAEEPELADALLAHRRYDVVILDLRMRVGGTADGLEILRELRRRDHWTSVIVLSAWVSPEVEEEAVRLGVDAVLRKPQPMADLAQLALALMGGH